MVVAGVCDPGPPTDTRIATYKHKTGLTEASYKTTRSPIAVDAVRQQVLAVYAEADAAVAAAAPRCDASGRCCRFTEYQHTLFISQFEAEILLETAPPYSQPASRDGCPFQVNGLCTARESRPLGCRIYFCDPAFAERMVEITEAAIAKLKAIANEHDTGWNYAPLHHFLNAARRSPTPTESDSMNTPDPRVPLPLISANKNEKQN